MVVAACVWTSSAAWGQTGMQPEAATPSNAIKAAPPPASRAPVARVEARPRWAELTAAQQRALQPLAASWTGISEGQKRKWLALSRNFAELPPPEQGKLHARMGAWVALSASERNQARMNFAEVKNLSLDDKQAKWDAYQALTEEERRKLAQQAPRVAGGAAPAVKPVPKQRLANVPARPDNLSHAPRITTAPHQVDRNTLLPQLDESDSGFPATSQH